MYIHVLVKIRCRVPALLICVRRAGIKCTVHYCSHMFNNASPVHNWFFSPIETFLLPCHVQEQVMVCSHSTTPRAIKMACMELCGGCLYCTETDTNTDSHLVLNPFYLYLCRVVWMHHLEHVLWTINDNHSSDIFLKFTINAILTWKHPKVQQFLFSLVHTSPVFFCFFF